MYYLYRRNIFNFGHNDGDIITDDLTLILDYAKTEEEIINSREHFHYEFYKFLERYKVINKEEKDKIIKILGSDANEYNWHNLLKKITFEQFKNLESQLKLEFVKIIKCEPQKKFYPLIRHSKFKEFGLDTKYYHDLTHLTYLLPSNNEKEAFEKGILFLLLTNDVSDFIGDPETTSYEADFLDIYYDSRKKMLDYFSTSTFRFFRQKIQKDLISKHGILKFWILENPYRIDQYKFDNFFQFKRDLLGNKIEHFDKIVELFTKKKSALIEVINI